MGRGIPRCHRGLCGDRDRQFIVLQKEEVAVSAVNELEYILSPRVLDENNKQDK